MLHQMIHRPDKLYGIDEFGGDPFAMPVENEQKLILESLFQLVMSPGGGHWLEIGPGGGRWTRAFGIAQMLNRINKMFLVDQCWAQNRQSINRFSMLNPNLTEFITSDDGDFVLEGNSALRGAWAYDVVVHMKKDEFERCLNSFHASVGEGGYFCFNWGQRFEGFDGWRECPDDSWQYWKRGEIIDLMADYGFHRVTMFDQIITKGWGSIFSVFKKAV